MRDTITISLPKKMAQKVHQKAKQGGFASTSEFIRSVLRQRDEEDKLLRGLEKSRREFDKGNYKVLHSLRDLR